jgi:hypothetical protein
LFSVAKLSLSRRGGLVLALLYLLLTLAAAGSSQAALLPTAPKVVCNPPGQFFLPWQDTAYYGIFPGGALESGTSGWSLGGGAKVVSGNETFYVNSRSDTHSLYMPAGSSVTTPAACFQVADWQVRFFLKNLGPSSGALRVQVISHGLLGIVSILDAGTVSAGSTWQPSAPVTIDLLSQLGGLLTNNTLSLRLTAVNSGVFQVDDLYLDPTFYSG